MGIERADKQLMVAAARHASAGLVTLAAASAVGTAAELAQPAAIAAAIDGAISHAAMIRPLAWLAIVLVAAMGSDAVIGLAQAYSSARAVAWLRGHLFDHLLRVGVPLAGRFARGDLVSRFVAGTNDVADAPVTVLAIALAVVRGVAAVVALWLIDWRLAAILLLGLPAAVAVLGSLVRKTTDVNVRYSELTGLISGRFIDALTGIRTIRASGTERREIERILAPLPELRQSGIEMWQANAAAAWLGALLMPVILVAVLAVAGFSVADGRIPPGQMIAACGYAMLGLSALGQSGQFARFGRDSAGARRVAELLRVAVMPSGGRDELPPGGGRLELRGVRVSRDGAEVLRDVDLAVPAGAVVALVGRSGAGKSTLASVAGRLIDPDEGDVLLDGVPLARLPAATLRLAVSYAFERPVLFGTSVADAIAGAAEHPDQRRVEAVASVAGIADFIRRLPMRYHTRLSDLVMSGGEEQRLGLARAYAQGGRLLILDDATSSLDMVTEGQITDAVSAAWPGRTQIVVAHRASTAARADLVAWLDGGHVRALAPHAELWADPDYRAVFAQDDCAGPGGRPPGTPAGNAGPGGRPPATPAADDGLIPAGAGHG